MPVVTIRVRDDSENQSGHDLGLLGDFAVSVDGRVDRAHWASAAIDCFCEEFSVNRDSFHISVVDEKGEELRESDSVPYAFSDRVRLDGCVSAKD